MNKDRRARIAAILADLAPALEKVGDAATALEEIRDEEQEYYDNMPESFQNGERGEQASNAVSALEELIEELRAASEIDPAPAADL